jgi:hypothetical protein
MHVYSFGWVAERCASREYFLHVLHIHRRVRLNYFIRCYITDTTLPLHDINTPANDDDF